MEFLFQTTIDVQVIPAATGNLTFNFATDTFLQNFMEKGVPTAYTTFIESMKDLKLDRKDNYRLEVHGECTLLSFLHQSGRPAYEYIGISKLCCVGCWYFFKAYNEFAEARQKQKFFVRGSHARAYPWVAPSFNSRDNVLDYMLPHVSDFFKNALYKGRQRSLSESTSGSLSEHRVSLDWDLLKSKIDQRYVPYSVDLI